MREKEKLSQSRDFYALQVALDLLSIEDALTVAEEAVKGGANWLEAGTPLIKNHGMVAVKKLASAFPHAKVVADMKTIDTGDLEVEMAAKNGAGIVSILALSENETIKRAINSARAHNVEIMADLIGVKNKAERARELYELGVDYILVHTPLDVQKVKLERVDKALDELKKITRSVRISVAVAGGINLHNIGILKEAGARIFVVGRALTKAKDVEATARKFCEIIGIKRERKEEEEREINIEKIIEEFEKIPTPFISDAMKRFGAMHGIKAVVASEKRIAGEAFTVRTLAGDWGKVVKAVDLAKEGSIIVVDAQGSNTAVWGELATRSAIKKKIKGVVIDGAVRDVDDIEKLGFPVFAKHIAINAGEPHGHGELNTIIACGGEVVKPGDIIIGDALGVVVVPRERAYEILKKSQEVAKKEKRYKESIKEGKTLSEIFGL